jgi:hypothetical protein
VLGLTRSASTSTKLRAIEGIGLSDVEMDTMLDVLHSLVRGAARGSVEKARDLQRTGMRDAR